MKSPSLTITPRDVIRYSKKIKLRVTEEEARRWLRRHAVEIARVLRRDLEENAEDFFENMFTHEYPEPQFQKMYEKIMAAIDDAEERFGAKHGTQPAGTSFQVEDMHNLIRFFQKAGKTQRYGVFIETIRFEAPDAPSDGYGNPYRIVLTIEGGKISGTLLGDEEITPKGVRVFGIEPRKVQQSRRRRLRREAHPLEKVQVSTGIQ